MAMQDMIKYAESIGFQDVGGDKMELRASDAVFKISSIYTGNPMFSISTDRDGVILDMPLTMQLLINISDVHYLNESTNMVNKKLPLFEQYVNESDVYDTKDEAEELAKKISKEEGVVQHVNKVSGGYSVDDWYDSDSTVSSYENGNRK